MALTWRGAPGASSTAWLAGGRGASACLTLRHLKVYYILYSEYSTASGKVKQAGAVKTAKGKLERDTAGWRDPLHRIAAFPCSVPQTNQGRAKVGRQGGLTAGLSTRPGALEAM